MHNIHYNFKRLLIHSLSISQTLSQSSNTLTRTPKSVIFNPSTCNKNHPHPQTLSSYLTIGFKQSPHPYLENPFCPYQWKFRFFSSLKVYFSYKNLSFLNNYSIWVQPKCLGLIISLVGALLFLVSVRFKLDGFVLLLVV